MDAQWIKSPTGRRVLEYWADPRPAWLWSADGETLLWRNLAARLFQKRGKSKKGQGALIATPIRGQVPRLIRLGSLNRSSLSRMQFLIGAKPVSATCACMPLTLADGETGLLVVGVDPIAPELPEAAAESDPGAETLLPGGADYLLVDESAQIIGGSPEALRCYGPALEKQGLPDLDGDAQRTIEVDGTRTIVLRFKASPRDASLLLFETPVEMAAPAEVPPAMTDAPPPVEHAVEPLLPMVPPPAAASIEPQTRLVSEAHWVERLQEPVAVAGGLSSLFDRLADNTALFAPLPADEDFAPPPSAEAPAPEAARGQEQPAEEAATPQPPIEGEAVAKTPADSAADIVEPTPDTTPTVQYRVIGRTFAPISATEQKEPAEAPAEPVPPTSAETPAEPPPAPHDEPALEPRDATRSPDAENVERVSRYNFDELSRILNDRVGNGELGNRGGLGPFAPPRPPPVPSATPEGALVTLGGETLVLNRLPLGIMVFRDQQVLFANRAITEMTGYPSVESLRSAGLGAIFPAGDEGQEAGPVNHLVQRDGMLVPVTARLQSVSWQGKPALMLSASATEVRTGHEAAVRAFAELVAENRADGFIETSRSGVLTSVSADARQILGRLESQLVGRPVSALAAPADLSALREFFERPARFAETARPVLTVRGLEPGFEITLFAQGQAGVVSGYFGFVRRTPGAMVPVLAAPDAVADPALLGRLSRGVRRPLNAVIGFADLIGTAAFGKIENERYLEYARDIKTAGLEIAALVDELDDFSRLRDGRYTARPTDIDLAGLLESSVLRLRSQANSARVLVRSAISERLPRIRADRASLAQAILNLLASAIDQTPQGGSVVLSAQVDDDGGIVINVRDSANNLVDLGERFVVFRDGVGRGGEPLGPVRSSVGLALTRALLAVNAMTLTVDPAASAGMLFSVIVPPESVVLMALPASTP
ncbi:MAG TPA: PAS domain-containing protein [Devosiaceae bacterium]|nr:PAS domain-containing protein [Devosiaceae bacterium]